MAGSQDKAPDTILDKTGVHRKAGIHCKVRRDGNYSGLHAFHRERPKTGVLLKIGREWFGDTWPSRQQIGQQAYPIVEGRSATSQS